MIVVGLALEPSTLTVHAGQTYPLGATWDGNGVNFALFAENAEAVELCLFHSVDSIEESARLLLPTFGDQVWCGYIPGLQPGQLYGYRVYGPWDPQAGHCFNPNKLLLDPYARAIARTESWDDDGLRILHAYSLPLAGSGIDNIEADLVMDDDDSAAYAPLGVVVDNQFEWGDAEASWYPTPFHRTIVYEAHARGLTMRHPDIPKDERGTYAAIGSQPIIDHLKKLGVTALELLPVHAHVNDPFLVEKGLKNYWGYNTLSFFAPELRYCTEESRRDPQGSIREFKQMVKNLHAARIEVIIDVVFNHTCEGNHLGPIFSFRGIDNKGYYKHMPDHPRYYRDYTGCGNTMDVNHPRVLQLIMDSMRYWVQEMHVDGFRFDLAPVMGRDNIAMDVGNGFFDIIRQDPVLCCVKLIAEPWDLADHGYQLGSFPTPWAEWNGRFRDTVRHFWKGDRFVMSDLATRICGSSDYFHYRAPYSSINFVTCHDGFTLQDLVSYNEKHNEANGENNNDGESHNLSWNCGVEGVTDDPDILALRARQKRNLMATLMLSMGVPMINSGDELGRSQSGNNNAYCQDNELSWQNWDIKENDQQFYEFVAYLSQIRRTHPVFQRQKFLSGKRVPAPLPLFPKAGTPPKTRLRDAVWYNPHGREMTEADWAGDSIMSVGVFLNGHALNEHDEFNQPIIDDSFLLLLNADERDCSFRISASSGTVSWEILLDTQYPTGRSNDPEVRSLYAGKDAFPLKSRSLVLLRLRV